MAYRKADYFGSSSPISGPSSSGASPSESLALSPCSSSVATSQLSLLALQSHHNSPTTSACTSLSDDCSEAEKISLGKGDALESTQPSSQPHASESHVLTEASEAAALEAESQRAEDELDSALAFGTQIVQREARALSMAAQRLSRLSPQKDGFREAIRLILRATHGERGGKIVLTGVGKSGIIAKKLSATFLSLGTPSMFLHPTEALHGDLGLLTPHRDVIIALSHSGSSPEILTLVPHLNARKCPIIALVGKRDSPLVRASAAWIDCATGKDDDSDDETEDKELEAAGSDLLTPGLSHSEVHSTNKSASLATCLCGQSTRTKKQKRLPRPATDEAWDDVPAPSSSTTVALAMGDALAFAVTRSKGLGRDTFAFNHPGGKLGADFEQQSQTIP